MPRRSRSPSRTQDDRQDSSRIHKRKKYHDDSRERHASHRTPTVKSAATTDSRSLPLRAAPISKGSLRQHKPLFALYLDVQKRLDIEDLPEDEIKGRWKSFVGKWNRGELAEGWYDPTTFQKAINAETGTEIQDQTERTNSPSFHDSERRRTDQQPGASLSPSDVDEDEDDFGPPVPSDLVQSSPHTQSTSRLGPKIPTLQDIRARDEQQQEDSESARSQERAELRLQRKADRRLQKERLDDIQPRAEAGSRERMLENKRATADAHRAFATSAHAGGDIDLKDADVMGDEDSIGELKRMQKEQARKKNERELRREEILRARMAEREERVRGMREKENKTMDMLKKIAQARFGE